MQVKQNRKELELSGTHQLLVNVDDVNLMREETYMYYKEN